MTVYIQGTKKDTQEKLKTGQHVTAIEFSLYGNQAHHLTDLPVGTACKFFKKYISGQPFATSYGSIKVDRKTLLLKLV